MNLTDTDLKNILGIGKKIEQHLFNIKNAGDISYKKMFGEYGVYCNGKVIGLVCDNTFYVKKTENGALIIGKCEEASPYTNAKPHFLIDDIDNSELITKLVAATYNELPAPKPKKKKQPL